MSHKSALSQNELHLATDLAEQSSQHTSNAVRFVSNPYIRLSIFLSLAAIVHLLGFNRAAQANDLAKASSKTRGDNSLQSPFSASALLPRIYNNLIAVSVKFPSIGFFDVDFSNDASNSNISASLLANSNLSNSVQNSQQSNSVNTISSAKTAINLPQRIYRVQQGDTISKIARKYQVSNSDLLDINQIKDSNVIFVNQQLKIPVNQVSTDKTILVENKQAEGESQPIQQQDNLKSRTFGASNSSKLEQKTSAGDSHIANLRTEINLLRVQYQPESATDSASVEEKNFANKAKLLPEGKTLSDSKPELNSLSQPNLGSALIESDAIALTLPLPPLPNQEYLPSAFDGYIWPAQGVLTSHYGWRWGRMHEGIDIAAPIGTPIVAAAAGEVVGAGWHDGYGNLIKLEHLDGSATYYAHTNRILVTHGQKVQQGEQIAEMGNTGNSTGSHLHFEIHTKDQKVIDPLALLGSR